MNNNQLAENKENKRDRYYSAMSHEEYEKVFGPPPPIIT
jgi:hypothetical protein